MYDGFHPDHTKHSIIYSQALRYNRICADTAERNHHLKTLKADFINRGYNPMIVDQYINASTRILRTHLLQYKQKPEINRVLLVTQEYSTHGHYNCSSFNVVYFIQCTKCITGGLYIEETGQSLRKRNTHHRFTITNKKLDTPIGIHFSSPHHSLYKGFKIFGT
ncbi:hypothetical protein XELAEV_18005928mg [Xenopus laevis]|uniref:Helix-turn-helix domain-containing protein n=1 Tax=Xenopus laevis TaxID=8355 RepID=A0A974DXW8_XENLA|nr:hypothetical protein XELAEV_18005928mg [Xenopus laevis]